MKYIYIAIIFLGFMSIPFAYDLNNKLPASYHFIFVHHLTLISIMVICWWKLIGEVFR